MIARLSCLCSFHNSEIFAWFIHTPIIGVVSANWVCVLTYAFLHSSVFVIVAATWAELPGTRSLRRVTKSAPGRVFY